MVKQIKKYYLLTIFGILTLLFFSGCNNNETLPGITWQGIVPGKTTLAEAKTLIGEPKAIETRSGYLVYRYEDMDQWSEIELWSNDEIVEVVFFSTSLPNWEKPHDTITFIEDLGRPETVGWSQSPGLRMLAWPKKGISLYSTVLQNNKRSIELEDQKVSCYALFSPMTKEELSKTTWPWPSFRGPASENQWTRDHTDAPDTYPKDPYKWFWIPRK